MNKISADNFSTNRRMLDKDVLRYCENFYQYCYHIIHFYNESLNINELRWLNFLIQRIELFLNDAPSSELTKPFIGRYSRCLKRLKTLNYDTRTNEN